MKITKNKSVYEEDINLFNGKSNEIIIPKEVQEIQEFIRNSKKDITIRGFGNSFVGGCVPNDSDIIDMSKMNKIIKIDPEGKRVLVEAGVCVNDLNKALKKFNLQFPIFPIFSKTQTIGGLISVNSPGMREIRYSKLRNWIDYTEIINYKGELIKLSRSDSNDFVGGEGLMGVIIRISLKLCTDKKRSISVIKLEDIEKAIEVGKKLKMDPNISMIYLIDKRICEKIDLENKYHLFVEFENEQGNMVDERYNYFINKILSVYKKSSEQGYFIFDCCRIPLDKLRETLKVLEENDLFFCSHVVTGIIEIYSNPDNKKINNILDIIKKQRSKIGEGTGYGLTRKEYIDSEDLSLLKRIKKRQDPYYKFNKNKVFDEERLLEEMNLEKEDLEKETKEIEENLKNIENKEIFELVDKNVIIDKKNKMTKEEEDIVKRIAGGKF